MDISWDDAQTFLAIAEAGSMSAGAVSLGIGQPTVSRRVAQLEARLGAALFIRSKQGVQLTEAGTRLRPAAEQMARWASEFERLATGSESDPAGRVRIAAPPGIAVDLLAPLARSLADTHPQLRLEVLASVDHLDLTRGDADLAIRTRAPTEPELMTLASGESPIGVFATPDYIARLRKRRIRDTSATSSTPMRLEEIDWVTWARPYEQVEPRPMLERAIPDFEPVFASDNYLVLRAAVAAGMGAMILNRSWAADESKGRLMEIDLPFALPSGAFHLVCAKSMQFVPRVRAVSDALIAAVRKSGAALASSTR